MYPERSVSNWSNLCFESLYVLELVSPPPIMWVAFWNSKKSMVSSPLSSTLPKVICAFAWAMVCPCWFPAPPTTCDAAASAGLLSTWSFFVMTGRRVSLSISAGSTPASSSLLSIFLTRLSLSFFFSMSSAIRVCLETMSVFIFSIRVCTSPITAALPPLPPCCCSFKSFTFAACASVPPIPGRCARCLINGESFETESATAFLPVFFWAASSSSYLLLDSSF
mmetsp:Transcript_25338/g.58711  ORF Transcript_25338/g.58711 Transcript_25338/m.58711 type:complete len:223 (-) Transcript_25338:505-1173(-)